MSAQIIFQTQKGQKGCPGYSDFNAVVTKLQSENGSESNSGSNQATETSVETSQDDPLSTI